MRGRSSSILRWADGDWRSEGAKHVKGYGNQLPCSPVLILHASEDGDLFFIDRECFKEGVIAPLELCGNVRLGNI